MSKNVSNDCFRAKAIARLPGKKQHSKCGRRMELEMKEMIKFTALFTYTETNME